MRVLEKRLAKLEGRGKSDSGPYRTVVLDGTREEVEAAEDQLKDCGENLIIHVIVPHVGESMNDFRNSIGLEPMDFMGEERKG